MLVPWNVADLGDDGGKALRGPPAANYRGHAAPRAFPVPELADCACCLPSSIMACQFPS